MKRILHVISQLEEGGAQRQLSYALSLRDSYEMEIASLIASPPERQFPFFRSCPVPIHFLSYTNDFYAPEILPKLRALLQTKKYSVVHCWLFESIVQATIASRLERIPCIAGVHGLRDSFTLDGKKRWELRLVEKTLRMADLVLFPSRTSAIDFAETGQLATDRIRVVQNGVDCRYFQADGSGDAFVTIGRISPEKGYEYLARVISELRRKIPEIRCIAVGGGSAFAVEGIEFRGFVEDVREVLRKAAVYITTSDTEGLSCALLEAQAMELPAVARNLGSNSEVIEHGINGYLAESIEDFVQSCVALWQDPGLRTRLGKAGRKKISETFALNQQLEKLRSVYGELL